MTHPQYRLVVEALPDDVPAVNRLRRFLKNALRAYRLKCVEAVELPEPKLITPKKKVL